MEKPLQAKHTERMDEKEIRDSIKIARSLIASLDNAIEQLDPSEDLRRYWTGCDLRPVNEYNQRDAFVQMFKNLQQAEGLITGMVGEYATAFSAWSENGRVPK